jgi:hypothetical protein
MLNEQLHNIAIGKISIAETIWHYKLLKKFRFLSQLLDGLKVEDHLMNIHCK